jgi:hypothetical protein
VELKWKLRTFLKTLKTFTEHPAVNAPNRTLQAHEPNVVQGETSDGRYILFGTMNRHTVAPPAGIINCTQVKTVFSRHLCIKTNILPRQARDKHRESTQKKVRFSSPAPAAGAR